MTYNEITSQQQWEEAFERSNDHPIVILKHSTTCPVSANAHDEFTKYLSDKPREDVEYLIVKVIESRPISLQIAEDTGIKHESPQVMMLDKKEKVWSATHWSVTKAHISAVLD